VKESVAVKKEKIKEENEDEAPQMRKAEKWYVNKEERLTRRPEEEQRPRKKRGRVKLI
jgi:hypothetical protein